MDDVISPSNRPNVAQAATAPRDGVPADLRDLPLTEWPNLRRGPVERVVGMIWPILWAVVLLVALPIAAIVQPFKGAVSRGDSTARSRRWR